VYAWRLLQWNADMPRQEKEVRGDDESDISARFLVDRISSNGVETSFSVADRLKTARIGNAAADIDGHAACKEARRQ
jgi:hypothetical protein